jgi:DNA-binding NarL/FixJ family response regulator
MSEAASGPSAPGAASAALGMASLLRAAYGAANATPATGRLSVLLVEDSPLLAERLREALTALAAVGEIRTVDREAAAIEAVGGADVVVLDLHLKQGTGFGVLRALRQRSEPQPVVIVFTNHDVPGYRSRAASLGAQHFLDKSRDFDRLGELLVELHLARGRCASA